MRSVLRWSAWLCLSLMLWTVAAESPTTTQSNGISNLFDLRCRS